MEARTIWIALNVLNVLMTGGMALFWHQRQMAVIDAARRATLEINNGQRAHLRPSRWRTLRRNRDHALGQKIVNGSFAVLGVALILAAIWWQGSVPYFVVGGTGAFTVIWAEWTALVFLDRRWMGEVARLVEQEDEANNAAGC